MKDVREMFNISYFDNKELSLKEHCDIYSNIKKELISILNKYDIKYVLAETEVIKDLSKENQELREIEKEHRTINGELRVENKELKKQLEEADLELQLLDMITDENIKYKNQQKEFIEFLEHQVKLQEEINDIHLATGFEEILSKYKEIIGSDSNE